MNKNKKRLIRNLSPKSNHTEIIDSPNKDDLMLSQFEYQGKSKEPINRQFADLNLNSEQKEKKIEKEQLQPSKKINNPNTQKASVDKPSASIPKQKTILEMFKNPNPKALSKKTPISQVNAPIINKHQQEEEDLKLALKLQMEEEKNVIKHSVQKYQNPRQSNQQISQTPQKQNFTPEKKQNQKESKKFAKKQGKGEKIDGPLNGQTIVFTGQLSICPREEIETILRNLGANITKSVSGKTTYLIMGDILEDGRPATQGNKYKQALEKKTKILKEADLDDWLFNMTKQRITDLFQTSKLGQLYSQKKPQAQQNQQIDLMIKNNQQSWADKYKPKSLNELIGIFLNYFIIISGNRSQVKSFVEWLENFGKPKSEQIPELKKKNFMMMQLGRWQPSGDKNSKACIISGPPGIGKSSMVSLVGQQLGYKIVGTNASELRNKASINTVLHHLVDNQLIGKQNLSSKFIIVMDEVDGMTGTDRGGLQAIVENIKNTKTPIICICNDKESQKLRTLLSYCYPINFLQPSTSEIVKRLQDICLKEKVNITQKELETIVEVFNGDIRQTLNFLHLQTIGTKNLKNLNKFGKDTVSVFNTFQAAQSLLNQNQRQSLKFREKMDLYFLDYDLMPLIIHDSYLLAMKQPQKQLEKKKKEIDIEEKKVEQYTLLDIELMRKAADLQAEGDIISKCIRYKGHWGLMPSQGFLSTIYPCDLVGKEIAFPKFPEFLGKNSSNRKIKREIKEIKNSISAITFNRKKIILIQQQASFMGVKLNYAPMILKLLKSILENKFEKDEKQAAWHATAVLEQYGLTPDMLKEHVCDIQFNPTKQNLLINVSGTIKGYLTRMFNKRHYIQKDQNKKKARVQLDQYKKV